jgi:hypothetical protein
MRLTSPTRRGSVRTAARLRIRPPADGRSCLDSARAACGAPGRGRSTVDSSTTTDRDAAVALGVDTVRTPGVCTTRAALPTRRARRTRSPTARRADAALPASIPTCPRVDSPRRGTPPGSRSAFCAHSIPARLGLLHDSCGLVRARLRPRVTPDYPPRKTLPDLGSVFRTLDPRCASRASARPGLVRTRLRPRALPTRGARSVHPRSHTPTLCANRLAALEFD